MNLKSKFIFCMSICCMLTCGTIFAANAECDSPSNLCYVTMTHDDGTKIKRGYYYNAVGHGTTYVNDAWVVGCDDGYYMPTSRPLRCAGGSFDIVKEPIKDDECCWPCPMYDAYESYQECSRMVYSTMIYPNKCDGLWCRGSIPNKDSYGGISTCTVYPENPDGALGSDSTGEWVFSSSCTFNGTEADIDSPCRCYPRTDYSQTCAS